MRARNGAIFALLVLATCSEDPDERAAAPVEPSHKALGTVPPTEVAVWRKVGSSTTPDGRYLQAAAFDETRQVVVLFGGTNLSPSTGTAAPNQETWEWSPATGKWTNRTVAGATPNARSGAAMVFDSVRGKMVLFGGRAGSGSNFEDTWEWSPATGVWTNVTAAGSHPSARAQHGMVFEKSTGKILLFGGGRSDPDSYDGSGVTVSLGDTWEYDPATYTWAALAPASTPSGRHDFGLVWDSARNKAVLFAGLQTEIAGATGVPKQDTWEWDPQTATWTERTAAGNKPSQRYGHAMAFDGVRKLAVVFGGWDIGTGGVLNDLWDWEPTAGTWTERRSGNEAGLPAPRMYASLVSNDATGHLELLAGAGPYNPYGTGGSYGTGGYYGSGGSYGGPVPVPVGMGYGMTGSREVWELEPGAATFTDRTTPLDVPSARYGQTMAYLPTPGKAIMSGVYMFGGYDSMNGQPLDDLWAWDGKTWHQMPTDVRPPARSDAALAYDPARDSLILYGGSNNYSGTPYGDTWEFTTTGKWAQLSPTASPDPLMYHGMVTDTTRNKIILFGGMSAYVWLDVGPYRDPMRNEVWEWDGVAMTWTNRTPPASLSAPMARQYPFLAYDGSRQKLLVYDGVAYGVSASAFWEWDPVSAGWTSRTTSDALGYMSVIAFAFDSTRSRAVMLTDPYNSSSAMQQTWELDPKGPTLYVRSPPGTSPGAIYGATAVFDSARGVVVVFGGQSSAVVTSETWEYSVTNLGNGEGCTAASAPTCASGNCVDGVCCDVAACTGPCKSCNVSGSEGTCVLAKAGTEVPGSCAAGQSCDGNGACLAKNGQPCTVAAACASGFCADGVCCDSACTGACVSCTLPAQPGKCSPYAAGTDPQGECGVGEGVCKSTCDGVGSCAYPQSNVTCAPCYTCDGMGKCSMYDYYCGSYGGSYGGTGGYIPNVGGTGGYIPNVGGSAGSVPPRGGSGGVITSLGGSTGIITGRGGSTSIIITGRGGSTGIPGYGGTIGLPGLGGTTAVTIPIPGYGGGPGQGDAGPGDAGTTQLKHSGCGCGLGSRSRGAGGLEPFLLAGLAVLLTRKRWRRR